MSFKREGNDNSLLGVLRKRRIKDLLTEDIPEDEAKLLSNGRFCCLVCSHHPIFDTINMLSMHRHGKKHKHYQEIHSAKKKELEILIRKRQQEEIMKNGKTSVSMDILGKGTLQSAVYNPCVKKGRHKNGERKPRVDLLGQQSPSLSDQKEERCPSNATDGRSHNPSALEMPRASSRRSHSAWGDVCNQQMQGPVLHSRQLKDIFGSACSSQRQCHMFHPYPSRTDKSNSSSTQLQYHKDEVHGCPGSNNFNRPTLKSNHSVSSSEMSQPSGSQSHVQGHSKSLKKPSAQTHSTCCKTIESSKSSVDTNSDLAAKYRLLQGSGWKKDWDGKWIRDEDAEFDSDEEPPELP